MEASMPKRKEPGKSLRIKVISMGNAEVGKSCIIKRYCEKRFVSKYLATIGIDYGVTKVQVRDREIKVNIFDMAGDPFFYETFYLSIVDLCENGGKRPNTNSSASFTKEQADTIRRIRSSKDSWDMLGVKPGASRDEVNKAYRKLAVLLHPDKCVAPGSEDAFKAVVNARTALLKNIK